MMRILAGVVADFDGRLQVGGEQVRFTSPADARRAGVAIIHQELSLIGPMTVADNIALGDAGSLGGVVAADRDEAHAREVLSVLSVDVDPQTPVEQLSLATRQLIEIARALAREARVLILDEPTSALSDGEADRLFEQLVTLRERGVAIVFISHRMHEIYRVADRITVLRDGSHVITAVPAALPRADLVRHMVGAEREVRRCDTVAPDAPAALTVRAPGVAFDVAGGEVLAVTGLHGSGADELIDTIFGARPADIEVTIGGRRMHRLTPRVCIEHGMIMLAGDRAHSVVSSQSVVNNVTLSALAAFCRFGVVDAARSEAAASHARDTLNIACDSIHAEVWQLSGGNQQKVAIARCLETKPRVLLLHEPSRGIDIGAKADVHALLAELAAAGVAIVVVGTDLDELMEVADRMLVMSRGRVVLELHEGDFTRARILAAAMGAT